MKRKYLTPHGVRGHQKSSQSESKQRRLSSQTKPIPLSSVFARLLNDVSKTSIAPKSHEYANFPNKQGSFYSILYTFAKNLLRNLFHSTKIRVLLFCVDVFHQKNNVKSNHRTRSQHVGEGMYCILSDLQILNM